MDKRKAQSVQILVGGQRPMYRNKAPMQGDELVTPFTWVSYRVSQIDDKPTTQVPRWVERLYIVVENGTDHYDSGFPKTFFARCYQYLKEGDRWRAFWHLYLQQVPDTVIAHFLHDMMAQP